MTKPAVQNKAVTVTPVARKNVFPPLCQTLKALCNQGLMQTNATAALGTMQIMVGLFNIGLGPGRTSTFGDLTSLGAAYWLGAVFIVSGVMCILAGQFPSSCLVSFAVVMNVFGAIFAITAIVLYAIDLSHASLIWMCDMRNNVYSNDKCRRVAFIAQNLLTYMDTTLIVLAVLQLCVNIRVVNLSIKTLTSDNEEDGEYVEDQLTGLKDVLLTSPVA